jgi:hypothetical protein
VAWDFGESLQKIIGEGRIDKQETNVLERGKVMKKSVWGMQSHDSERRPPNKPGGYVVNF